MTRLFNDPDAFADEVLEGFVAAHGDLVSRVPGGLIRNSPTPAGKVAVVIGGGAGHYPAFAGLVGPGMADGAAIGNIFASPSAKQIYSVARSASRGGGVLLGFGNYAGDVLHFGQAAEKLNADGIPTMTLAVTDDISSATTDEIHKRRGVAGDLAVFKVAAAAAEDGLSLEDVHRIACRANDRTRSLGVAFTGCTLPGAGKPLFTVPPGRMAVGMGIHGEPGTGETDVPTADELAEILVTALLAETPDVDAGGARVGLILNGLGTVKHEELFVVYRRIAQLLTDRGVTTVQPEVGEFVTSYDMAGVSLTMFWLDEELEKYWTAPAHSAAYRKGNTIAGDVAVAAIEPRWVEVDQPVATADDASREAARTVIDVLTAIRDTVEENVQRLGDIDAVAGDGDHGIGMQRGARAAVSAASTESERGAGAGAVLNAGAEAWADVGGGTSGALWGVALRAVAAAIGDDHEPDAKDVADGVAAALRAVQQIGKADIGDKTLVDVLAPASAALTKAVADGHDLGSAFATAAAVANDAADATAQMLPKIGRARPLAEKSRGTPDPGAVSMALAFNAVHRVLARKC
ncbi:dihydroxyacetone kinase family protein [Mycolicibacterium sp. P9-64]|uniref:dihydroxyacetone kinase family protein n=1 Tax=Mycolicibacterium sp. P9-64 TaxID=2024612 RepID=UPI0011EE2EB3|nr:dihydroxyacetone kinase family protein [Mycolicibacterium sp. P9-64]KAA0080754.1 dihydroxyacetone kinase family protein [Mycolicibacterium sp. P9-64]